jgi:hypothetical protein
MTRDGQLHRPTRRACRAKTIILAGSKTVQNSTIGRGRGVADGLAAELLQATSSPSTLRYALCDHSTRRVFLCLRVHSYTLR